MSFNIPRLKEAIARKDVYIVGAPDEELFALVEVVEAAKVVWMHDDDARKPIRPVLELLYEKVNCFDFRDDV